MTFLWLMLLTLAGLLMSLAHPFRSGSLEMNPGIFSFLSASIGIAIFMKVSGLRARAKTRFFLGTWAGFVYYCATMYWVVLALKGFGNLNIGVALLVTAILCLYCAVYMGLWSMISGFVFIREKNFLIRVLIWASLWTSLETVREHIFTGLSWGEIGYHFSAWPFIAKTTSVWGVHGLTFLWIILISLVLHIDEWWNRRRSKALILSFSFFMMSLGGVGYYLSVGRVETQPLKVALIQPNISQGLKWNPESARDHLNTLIEMTKEASAAQPDLIVWPETSYPFLIGAEQKQLPFQSSIPLIIGAVISEGRVNKNAALLIQADKIQQRFDKIHLVPFGEYVPFEDYLPFQKLVANVGRFRPGLNSQPALNLKSKNIKIGPLICYEDAFSRHSVDLSKKGAQLLVNLTNDAWYGESSALEQHAAMANMQSYQTGLPILRSTNTGTTSILDSQKHKKIKTYEKSILIEDIQVPKKAVNTWYVASYPLMQWIWLLILGACLMIHTDPRKHRIFFKNTDD